MDEVKVTKLINGPEAFTPDNEFCLGESEVARLLRRRRLLRPRARRRRRDRQGDRRVDRRGRAEPRPLGDGRAPLRRPVPLALLHPRPDPRDLRDLLRHPLSEPRAQRRAAAADVGGERLARRARRRLRREVRLGAGQLVRVERRRGRRVAAPARLGGPALVAGDRRRAPRDPRGGGDLRRVLVREDGDRGPGRGASCSSGCATTGSPARSARSPTRRCSTARGGIECDFTVARLGEELFSIVTGTAFGNHDREWIRKHLPDDGSASRSATSTSAWACFGIWGPRAREVLAPLTPQDLSNEAFPYMSVREITVGDVPVRALRVTYVGELGWEIYCPTEYGLGLWRALWEAGEPHGIVAGGYRAIDSMRLEKGYRVWGADITPDETPYEGGVGFCVKLDKEGGFIGREALAEAKRARAADEALLPDAGGPALGGARQRAGAGRRRDPRAGDHRRLRLHGRALDRLRLPAARARRAGHRRWRSRSSASGSTARSRPSRCSTRRASGSGD